MTEKMVQKTSGFLDRVTNRRGFLVRVAGVGAAASLGPLRTLMRPTPAWAAFGDGYTEFCCKVVGFNGCPSYTFIGGYWKCTSYSGGGLCAGTGSRYYVDCNLGIDNSCNCVAAGGDTACRGTCCNNFQYGNCNAGHDGGSRPIICRKVMCDNPAASYSFCSYNTPVDNNTCDQHACDHCD
jgi:hypothetical protein